MATGTSPLSADARALLATIREALDLPRADGFPAHEERERMILTRVTRVLATLDFVVDDADAGRLPYAVEGLREYLDRHPVDYAVRVEVE